MVPAISGQWKDKTFGASDIKWVKNVNDGHTHSAYLASDEHERVIIRPDGVFFCLQLNDLYVDSLNQVGFGEVILLYQRLLDENDNTTERFFTHLVTPWGDHVVPSPYGPRSPWPGRWVKVIAITRDTPSGSIRVARTMWPVIGFNNEVHRLLTYQDGRIRKINHNQQLPDEQLPKLQKDIWDRFGFFFERGPEYFLSSPNGA
jgi:hypothetical protein